MTPTYVGVKISIASERGHRGENTRVRETARTMFLCSSERARDSRHVSDSESESESERENERPNKSEKQQELCSCLVSHVLAKERETAETSATAKARAKARERTSKSVYACVCAYRGNPSGSTSLPLMPGLPCIGLVMRYSWIGSVPDNNKLPSTPDMLGLPRCA